jgi:hypothetical protein
MASERRLLSVATTIPVSNVQALAARSADELPAETLGRYIRPGIDQDAVLEEHSDELPVVDLGRLLNRESWEQEAAKLKFACEEWGFFQVYMLPKNQNYCQCSAVSFILSIYSLTAKIEANFVCNPYTSRNEHGIWSTFLTDLFSCRQTGLSNRASPYGAVGSPE